MKLLPLIVWLGAGGKAEGKAKQLCKFLGDISYPIYITHFPVMYVYYAWVVNNGYNLSDSWAGGLLTAVVSLSLAYGLMKLYDIPLRTWLRNRFLSAKKKVVLYKTL